MQTLHQSILLKSVKVKLSVYWSIYVSTLTYSYEIWVVTEKMKLCKQQKLAFWLMVIMKTVINHQKATIIIVILIVLSCYLPKKPNFSLF